MRPLRPWVILLILSGILFLFRLGDRALWSPDEPRFGLLSQEMLRDGHVIVPHLEGAIHTEKPPLYPWLASLTSLVAGGVSEATVRLPSALAATASVLLTFFLGRRFFGERAGWLGASVLLTAGHFLMRGRWASTDMTLSFLFLLSMFCLSRAFGVGTGGGVHPRAGRWFFVTAALATLTKGPVGLVLPLAVLAVFLLAERRLGDLRRFPWATGLALYLLLCAPWYFLYGLQAGWENLRTVLLKENVNRYVQAWNNQEPFHYYLHRFPLSFLPWSVFFPAAAVALARRWRSEGSGPMRFLTLWFAVVFLFYSISSGKRTVYLLPLFPAAALLVGWFLDRGWTALGDSNSRWLRGTTLVLAFFFVLAAVTMPAVAFTRYREAFPPALGLGLLLAGTACLVARHGWRGRPSSLAVTVVGAVILLAVISDLWLIPVLDGYHNVRSLSARIAQAVPPGSRFATTREKREAVFFYTGLAGERIRGAGDLERFLASREPAYCLLPLSDWERYSREGARAGSVLLRGEASNHSLVLVSNEANHAP